MIKKKKAFFSSVYVLVFRGFCLLSDLKQSVLLNGDSGVVVGVVVVGAGRGGVSDKVAENISRDARAWRRGPGVAPVLRVVEKLPKNIFIFIFYF